MVDFDADGHADLVAGVPEDNQGGSSSGSTLVLQGPIALTGTTSGSVNNYSPHYLVGEDVGDESGAAVANAGDLNVDGLADLVIGAPGEQAAYVFYANTGWSGTIDLSAASAKLTGVYADTGIGVEGTGDVTGDGYDDLLIASTRNVFIVPGLSVTTGPITGVMHGQLTTSTNFANTVSTGDANGDGYLDFLVARSGTGGASGEAYLVHGPVSNTVSASGSAVATFTGTPGTDRDAVALFDADADGMADLVIADADGSSVYVFAGAITGTLAASAAESTWTLGETFGDSMAKGDINGDGVEDLVVGNDYWSVLGCAGRTSGAGPGLAVMYGDSARTSWSYDWYNRSSCSSGYARYVGKGVAVGDVDGDGLDDVTAGAAEEGSSDDRHIMIWQGLGL